MAIQTAKKAVSMYGFLQKVGVGFDTWDGLSSYGHQFREETRCQMLNFGGVSDGFR